MKTQAAGQKCDSFRVWKCVRRVINEKSTKPMRISFASAMICGFLAHFVYLSNIINNYDSITQIPAGLGTGTTSGRWMISFVESIQVKLWYDYNIPFFNSFMSLCILGIAACFVIKILNIDDPFHAFSIGGIITVFPAATSMMFFSYTAPIYSLAILMTVMSVCLSDKKLLGMFSAIVLQVLSLAIYQAYLPVAAGLFVLKLVNNVFSEKWSFGVLIKKSSKFLSILIASVCLYIFTTRMILYHSNLSLSSYQSIDKMGRIDLSAILNTISTIYDNVFGLVCANYYGISATPVSRLSFLVSFISSAVLLIVILLRCDSPVITKVAVLVLCAVLPIAADSIEIMCIESNIYTIMAYGLISVLLLPVVLEEVSWRLNKDVECLNGGGKIWNYLMGSCNALISVSLILIITNYMWSSNVNYTSLYYTNEQTQQYYSALTTRMRSAEGYEAGMKVVFINSRIQDPDYISNWQNMPEQYGGNSFDFLNVYSRNDFIRNLVGYSFATASDEETNELMEKEETQKMPSYPDYGSIKVIDGILVVKLDE